MIHWIIDNGLWTGSRERAIVSHMRAYRSLSAAAVAVVLCALLGGFFGRGALVAQDQIAEQYRVFTAALDAVETGFVGEVESDRLVYGIVSADVFKETK